MSSTSITSTSTAEAHQTSYYTNFENSSLTRLQPFLQNFKGSVVNEVALHQGVEREWEVLKTAVINHLKNQLLCPTCGQGPVNVNGETGEAGNHQMSKGVNDLLLSLKNWDFVSAEQLLDNPADWLLRMEWQFKMLEKFYWDEELTNKECSGGNGGY